MLAKKSRVFDQQLVKTASNLNREKKTKNIKKLFKLIFLLTIVLLALGVLLKIPGYWENINKPFQNIQTNLIQSDGINLKQRTNILLLTVDGTDLKEMGVLTLQETDRRVFVLKIDTNSVIDPETETVTWGSFYENSLHAGGSIDYFVAKVIKATSVTFNGYLVLNSKESLINQSNLEDQANALFGLNFILSLPSSKSYLDKNLKTNLSVGEIWSILREVKSKTPERFETEFLTSKNQIGQNLQDRFLDQSIRDENVTVKIVNASSVDGVGSVVSSILKTTGVNIIELDRDTTRTRKSVVNVVTKTETGKRLEQLLNTKQTIGTRDNNGFDILVVVGEDFAQYFQNNP